MIRMFRWLELLTAMGVALAMLMRVLAFPGATLMQVSALASLVLLYFPLFLLRALLDSRYLGAAKLIPVAGGIGGALGAVCFLGVLLDRPISSEFALMAMMFNALAGWMAIFLGFRVEQYRFTDRETLLRALIWLVMLAVGFLRN